MDTPLAVDEAGNALTAFHPVAERDRPADAPVPLALVVLRHRDRTLLVLNRYRDRWELPGGMIDPGETPRRAAVRELREESGYHVEDLTFAGYARFVLGPERRVEYAAVYTARLAGDATPPSPFTPTEEIGAIRWWDGTHPLPGRVQPLDVALAHLALARPWHP